jgi:hypothetical protein
VTRVGWRLCVVCAAAGVAACLAERLRPGPPFLSIVLNKTSVHSPDTLTGTLRAEDASGLDSIWLSVDYAPTLGEDGLLKPVFEAPFRTPIAKGHTAGQRVPVQFMARDFEGFVARQDTVVVVIP